MVVTKEERVRTDQIPDQNVLRYTIPERLQGQDRIRFAQNRLRVLHETIIADNDVTGLLNALELAQQIFHMHCSLSFNPRDIHRGMVGSERTIYNEVVSAFHDALNSEHAEVAYLAATSLLSLNEANDRLFQVFSQPRMLDLNQDFLEEYTDGRNCLTTLRNLAAMTLNSYNIQNSIFAINAMGDLANNLETSPEHLTSIFNCFQSLLRDSSDLEGLILAQIRRISQSRSTVFSQLSSSVYPIVDMLLERNNLRPDRCFLLSTVLGHMPEDEVRARRLESLRSLFIIPENVPLATVQHSNQIRTFADRSFLAQVTEESLFYDASPDDLPPAMARATERALEIIRQCEWIPAEIRESFFRTPPLVVVDDTLGVSEITGSTNAGCHVSGTNLIFLVSRSGENEVDESTLLTRVLHECLHYMDDLAGGSIDVNVYMRTGRNNAITYPTSWINEGLCELFNNRVFIDANQSAGSIPYVNEVGVVLYLERLLETSTDGRSPRELLFRAFLSDDFTEVQRQINLRLGENAFERLMTCRNGAEAVVAIIEMMTASHISHFSWSASIISEISR